MKTIIALHGLPGSGKSEVRKILVQEHGFFPLRVAKRLKEMLWALGCDDRHIEGVLKEEPCGLLGGVTPRRFMQTLGRELPDALGVPDLWGRLWAEEAQCLNAPRIVVEDHRYPNELSHFMSVGKTQVWQINRPGFHGDNGAMQHQAEWQENHWDQQVWNEGTLEDLKYNIAYRMQYV